MDVVRDATLGWDPEYNIFGLEGSQAMLVSCSARVKAYDLN
jgi:hypothetical protein